MGRGVARVARSGIHRGSDRAPATWGSCRGPPCRMGVRAGGRACPRLRRCRAGARQSGPRALPGFCLHRPGSNCRLHAAAA
eukprot:7896426-Alexandrium_andersonii.AAC.1